MTKPSPFQDDGPDRAVVDDHGWSGAGILGAVAVGGSIGALARYGLSEAFPTGREAFPWATFAINVVGCFGIGMLLEALSPRSHPLIRPFLGTGVLGGFTTFSSYTVETAHLLDHRPVTAVLYFFGTLAAALTAVHLGAAAGLRLRLRLRLRR